MNSARTLPSLPAPRRSAINWAPYWFVAPYVVLTLAFFVFPLYKAAELALYQTAGAHARVWVGWDNFRFLFGDPDFRKALLNTAVFFIFGTGVMVPCALGLALLLNAGKDRLKGFFRLVFFSPNIVGPIFVGLIFALLFEPRTGIINRLIHALLGWGLEQRWLETPALVMPAIAVTNTWMYAGFNMIYFLAALQNVDRSLVEAARIDGAGRWATFWNVTMPAIKPVAIFVLIMCTIGSFQVFELPYALMRTGQTAQTAGGPANSALFIVSYLFDAAYNLNDLGLASAVGWILAAIIFLVSIVQLRLAGAHRE